MCGHAYMCQCAHVHICLGMHDGTCAYMHAATGGDFTTYSKPRYFICILSTLVHFFFLYFYTCSVFYNHVYFYSMLCVDCTRDKSEMTSIKTSTFSVGLNEIHAMWTNIGLPTNRLKHNTSLTVYINYIHIILLNPMWYMEINIVPIFYFDHVNSLRTSDLYKILCHWTVSSMACLFACLLPTHYPNQCLILSYTLRPI